MYLYVIQRATTGRCSHSQRFPNPRACMRQPTCGVQALITATVLPPSAHDGRQRPLVLSVLPTTSSCAAHHVPRTSPTPSLPCPQASVAKGKINEIDRAKNYYAPMQAIRARRRQGAGAAAAIDESEATGDTDAVVRDGDACSQGRRPRRLQRPPPLQRWTPLLCHAGQQLPLPPVLLPKCGKRVLPPMSMAAWARSS